MGGSCILSRNSSCFAETTGSSGPYSIGVGLPTRPGGCPDNCIGETMPYIVCMLLPCLFVFELQAAGDIESGMLPYVAFFSKCCLR